MRKQYRYYEINSFLYNINLYYDGVCECTRKVWLDELDEILDELESKGYTQGFTENEVNEAKRIYEKRLKNMICEKGN